MRFHADGPDIPVELLEARDRGEVIFLCGAGVSMPAGLPSFLQLARRVVVDLGVPDDGEARQLLAHAIAGGPAPISLDQIFDKLNDDYGAVRVEAAVARRLRPPSSPDLSLHRTVLRLSADERGRARVVTTNFDPLFDRVPGRRLRHKPPYLPELGFGGAFEGVVYLHGQVDAAAARAGVRQGLVLSATDFGRAYLAQGWATRFVRQLLDRFTLVLLGYSADDPPVRYLLQGLRDEHSRPGALYAFASGDAGALEAKWRARGVQAISYTPSDAAHANLWRSLSSWADRAEDTVGWQARLIERAAGGPQTVEPHVRGQVAALLQTVSGARAWAEANPPPPSEWLCVLDNRLRFARPQRPWAETVGEPRDSLDAYGLDSDPPRPVAQRRDTPAPGLSLLTPIPDDRQGAAPAGLICIGTPIEPLRPRLFQLGRWIAKVAREPLSLWWAAGQPSLHPVLADALDRATELPSSVPEPEFAAAWRLLLEAHSGVDEPRRHRWYDLERTVRRRGWSEGALRELAEAIRPALACERPGSAASLPPDDLADVRRLVSFEVRFLDVREPDQRIPDEVLIPVVAHWRAALGHGASLLRDLQPRFWRAPTLFADGDVAGGRHAGSSDEFIHAFVRLLERLTDIDAEAARREIAAWPEREPFLFDALRVWAAHRAGLMSPSEAGATILDLTDATFWSDRGTRDLLISLRARWSEFGRQLRTALEKRLLAGPPPWSNEKEAEHARRAAIAAATRLGWLEAEGCALSSRTKTALPRLRAADGRWRPEWDRSAANSHEPRAGWVETVTDPTGLLALPLQMVAERARAAAAERPGLFQEADPFQGLVEQRPARALAALALELRRGAFPADLWATLLDGKGELPSRTLRLLAHRLTRLPTSVMVELRFSAPRWLVRNMGALTAMSPNLAWEVWDSILGGVASGGEAATESSLGEVLLAGVAQPRSRRTYEHALNSPIGELVHAAISLPPPPGSKGPSEQVLERLGTAMDAPGEGGDHAASIILSRLPWLFHAAPEFAATLLPMLEPSSPSAEPAWSGYLAGGQVGGPALFGRLRHHFLKVFAIADEWRWVDGPQAEMAGFLAAMLMSPDARRFLTLPQARSALQSGGASAGETFLDALMRYAAPAAWPRLRRVLLGAWPQEMGFQTEGTASRLVELALAVGEHFPAAVQVVQPILRPLAGLDLIMHQLGDTEDEDEDTRSIAQRFPAATLALLDRVVGPAQSTYNLAVVMGMIAEAEPNLRQTPAWRRLNELALR